MDAESDGQKSDARPAAGPLPAGRVRWVPVDVWGRWTWAVCALGGLGLVVIAALTEPDPVVGRTRSVLPIPRCGVLVRTGWPCPSCGMTTAFAYVVRGRLDRALLAQPAGALFGLVVSLGWPLGVVVAVSGRRPGVAFWVLRHSGWLLLGLGVFWIGSWGLRMVYGWWIGEFPSRGP